MTESPWTDTEVREVLRAVLIRGLGLAVVCPTVPTGGISGRQACLPVSVGQTRYLLQLHADADAAAALVEVLSGSAEQVVAPDIEQEAVSEALNLIGGRLAGVSQRDAEPVTLGTPLSVRGITTAKALWSIECAVCGGRMRFELYPT